ncbi:hypothetical protein [Endozoicomonas euniceicola]|uniref:Uncharacterized protein n=1 Tax=Endozoicomonas euniceicola TaxID=1234143 RepID=A0ABY6H112_9GAMM|nr:hypothetical protein [Endozoicomonas euniceicola]UYM18755.1 hypothetical protein NX720_12890 [Endozoicomonas euniceicola]
MGIEQRVEALEIQQARWDVVIRGTHDVVCLILKEQRQFERELCDIKRKQAEHDERFDKMDDRFDKMDDRFDKMEKKFDDRIDKLERLIVSSLLEKTEGAEKKDLT